VGFRDLLLTLLSCMAVRPPLQPKALFEEERVFSGSGWPSPSLPIPTILTSLAPYPLALEETIFQECPAYPRR